MDTFESDDDEDEEEVAEESDYDKLGSSQLPNAPSTQPTQVVGTRRRCPPCKYTPSTNALGHKGKAVRVRLGGSDDELWGNTMLAT